MKKSLIFLGLVSLTALAVSCEKEAIQKSAVSGDAFTIIVNADGSKTTVDNLATTWVEGDQINVFHAENGTGNYVSDGAFTVANITTGAFGGQLGSDLTGGKSYDWTVIYPYAEGNTASAAAFSIPATQTQDGNGSQAHLGGAPLWGNATAVAAETCPAATLSHLASYIRVKVKNTCGKTLTVHSVKFTATENISGNFSANLSGDTPAIAAAGSNSKTVLLNVENPTAIDNGATADFYLAINPFTAASGATLTVSINTYIKPLILEADAVFTSGKIKTLNFEYDLTTDMMQYAMWNYNNNSASGGGKLANDTRFPGCVPYVDSYYNWMVYKNGYYYLPTTNNANDLCRSALISQYDPAQKKVVGVLVPYQHSSYAGISTMVNTDYIYVVNKGALMNTSGVNQLFPTVPNASYDYAKAATLVDGPTAGGGKYMKFNNTAWPSAYGGVYFVPAYSNTVNNMKNNGYTIEVYACASEDVTWSGGESSESALVSYRADDSATAGTRLFWLGVRGEDCHLHADIKGTALPCYNIHPVPGKFFHAVLVYDKPNNKEYLYWNGVKVAERTETRAAEEIMYYGAGTGGNLQYYKDKDLTKASKNPKNPFVVGGAINPNYNASTANWCGIIKYVNIYAKVLTPEQVATSYRYMHFAENNE